MKTKNYYVTMTDKFMSGWGRAHNMINKLVIICETYEQARAVLHNAKKRPEMKRVNLRHSCPSYGSHILTSWKNFSELGECWTKI